MELSPKDIMNSDVLREIKMWRRRAHPKLTGCFCILPVERTPFGTLYFTTSFKDNPLNLLRKRWAFRRAYWRYTVWRDSQ
jgi:hypothetical protein